MPYEKRGSSPAFFRSMKLIPVLSASIRKTPLSICVRQERKVIFSYRTPILKAIHTKESCSFLTFLQPLSPISGKRKNRVNGRSCLTAYPTFCTRAQLTQTRQKSFQSAKVPPITAHHLPGRPPASSSRYRCRCHAHHSTEFAKHSCPSCQFSQSPHHH